MGSKVFAVIPVHNGIQHTLATLQSLLPLMPPQGRVVVVDDGSSDGTGGILRQELPQVTVLEGDGHLWWSGAINLGAGYALQEGADYALFLNNDIILHPQFLEELLIGASEFPGSLIASKILSADEPWKVWSIGGKVNWLKGKIWMLGHGQSDIGRWREPVEADWLPGMSVLVPAEVFQQGIRIDQDTFPQYSGDSDFSIRARKAGFKLVVWPRSVVYNKVNHSGLDTKLLLRLVPFSLRSFTQSLTSVKSSLALRTVLPWIRRHVPIWAWPLVLGRTYGFYFLKCLQIGLGLPSLLGRKTGRFHHRELKLNKNIELTGEQLPEKSC